MSVVGHLLSKNSHVLSRAGPQDFPHNSDHVSACYQHLGHLFKISSQRLWLWSSLICRLRIPIHHFHHFPSFEALCCAMQCPASQNSIILPCFFASLWKIATPPVPAHQEAAAPDFRCLCQPAGLWNPPVCDRQPSNTYDLSVNSLTHKIHVWYTYIYHQNQLNAGEYIIHGSYG